MFVFYSNFATSAHSDTKKKPIAMKNINTVIFDLDGTLLDTITDLHASVNHALGKCGLPTRTTEEVRRALGYGFLYLIENSVPENADEKTIKEVLTIFKEHYYIHSMDKTRPYEKIPQMLEQIKAKGYKMAIVSNKGMEAAKKLARHFFSDTIEIAIGESAKVKRKPAPDTVIEAMHLLDSTKEESLYVGDSEVDIATAKNAGIRCLSVSWGFRTAEQLKTNGATDIISRPTEIIDFLERQK